MIAGKPIRAPTLSAAHSTSSAPATSAAATSTAMPRKAALASRRLTAEFGTTPPRDDEWQAIVETLPAQSRFATPAWFRAWGEHFLPYQRWRPPLRYVAVRAGDGRLRAIFPFAAQRSSGISVSSLAGFYWPYRTPVVPENAELEIFEALAEAFTRSRSTPALRYGPVAEADPGVAGLNAALERRGWRIRCLSLGESYVVELPEAWEQFERSLGKKLRTNAEYYERKMKREGVLEIRCTKQRTGAQWSNTLRDLASIEGESWQQKAGGKARFFGEPNQTYWRSLLSDSGSAGMARAWVMHFNGQPVSFCFFLDCGETRHIIANHYAEQVREYGTGSILYRHVFRDAIESGVIRRVDIGLGDSGYKSRWSAQPSHRLLDWMAFRPGPFGRLLELATRLRH